MTPVVKQTILSKVLLIIIVAFFMVAVLEIHLYVTDYDTMSATGKRDTSNNTLRLLLPFRSIFNRE